MKQQNTLSKKYKHKKYPRLKQHEIFAPTLNWMKMNEFVD